MRTLHIGIIQPTFSHYKAYKRVKGLHDYYKLLLKKVLYGTPRRYNIKGEKGTPTPHNILLKGEKLAY